MSYHCPSRLSSNIVLQPATRTDPNARYAHTVPAAPRHDASPTRAVLFVHGLSNQSPTGEHAEETLAAGRPNGTVVACIGDSITHGRIGFNWVDTLRTRLPAHHFVNAGINGNVAWQVNERLDPVLACKPDIAIVLIGTNDAMASHNPDWGARYKRSNKLPEVPTLDGYATQLETLLRRLSDVPHVAVWHPTAARVSFQTRPSTPTSMRLTASCARSRRPRERGSSLCRRPSATGCQHGTHPQCMAFRRPLTGWFAA